ncbi:LysR substrate-binding domain-containing protein [Pseudomonas chlororaphis]|uniref:LysR family transcriptional regulator n=1 Tax=Pseudomonas chlororaphis TaxID=587753 RepID=UPI0030D31F36
MPRIEFRHLRYFIALAEELHFSRAAGKLSIEPSPLSRAIKELELELKVVLFDRNRRGTRLTDAGELFLVEARRLFSNLDSAVEIARQAATGYRKVLRVAVSDGVAGHHLAALLALCRAEEPEVMVQLTEVPLAEQLRGLRNRSFDAGFACEPDPGQNLIAKSVWTDPLVVVVPERNPLVAHRKLPLHLLRRQPLILCHPQKCEGLARQMEHVVHSAIGHPESVCRATSVNMMLTLVAAGYGIGFATEGQLAPGSRPGVVVRSVADDASQINIYFLRRKECPSEQLLSFSRRVKSMVA